jgi:hypothetical protein
VACLFSFDLLPIYHRDIIIGIIVWGVSYCWWDDPLELQDASWFIVEDELERQRRKTKKKLRPLSTQVTPPKKCSRDLGEKRERERERETNLKKRMRIMIYGFPYHHRKGLGVGDSRS